MQPVSSVLKKTSVVAVFASKQWFNILNGIKPAAVSEIRYLCKEIKNVCS